jgi:AcrR family transcriptional regulator
MVRPLAVDLDQTEHTYHHGNLRRALMDAALEIIREQGVDALTLRDLARRTGVTHAAPHHHFRDKTALLTALCDEGLLMLDQAMTAAEERSGTDPTERLIAVGRAYVMFAAEDSDYFTVMYRPEPYRPDCEQVACPAAGRVWGHLIDGIVACQQAGVAPQGDPLPIAIHLWSLVHGLSTLWISGSLSFPDGSIKFAPSGGDGIEGIAEVVLRNAGRDLALAARAEGLPAPAAEGQRE